MVRRAAVAVLDRAVLAVAVVAITQIHVLVQVQQDRVITEVTTEANTEQVVAVAHRLLDQMDLLLPVGVMAALVLHLLFLALR